MYEYMSLAEIEKRFGFKIADKCAKMQASDCEDFQKEDIIIVCLKPIERYTVDSSSDSDLSLGLELEFVEELEEEVEKELEPECGLGL